MTNKRHSRTRDGFKQVKELVVGDRFACGPVANGNTVFEVTWIGPARKVRRGKIDWRQDILVKSVHGSEDMNFSTTDEVEIAV